MNRLASPALLAAILVAWALAFAGATASQSELAFKFAYFVLPASALFVPLVVATLTIRLRKARLAPQRSVGKKSLAGSFAAYLLAGIAYVMSFAVLARLHEIPWRRSKFGGEALDLGLSAALLFAVTAGFLCCAALALLRHLQPGSRAWAASSACVSMLAFAASAYLLAGISPLVQWRA